MAPRLELYDELSNSCLEDALHEGRQYVSVDTVRRFITKDSIRTELKRNSGSFSILGGRLAEQVIKRDARRMFAILVYIDKPWDIKKLLTDGFTDEDLPLAKHGLKLRSTYNISKTFRPPKDWVAQTVDHFLLKQWIMLAP